MTATDDIQLEDSTDAATDFIWAALDDLCEAQEQWDREQEANLPPVA